MAELLEELMADWNRRGLGFRCGDRLVNLAGFADDLVLVVGSFLVAKQMVAELIVAFVSWHLKLMLSAYVESLASGALSSMNLPIAWPKKIVGRMDKASPCAKPRVCRAGALSSE